MKVTLRRVGTDDLSMWIVGPNGGVKEYEDDDGQIRLDLRLTAGSYTFTVQQHDDDRVEYEVRIEK